MSKDYSRRELLKGGGVLAVGLMTPPWLASIAKADMITRARGGKSDPETVLVVCQLSGGNDGLNTVIPINDNKYYEMRETIAIGKDKALPISNDLGLHPDMGGVHEMFKAGNVAIVQGVGYPNPNRSHFKSMDIWQTASPDVSEKYGWIGRHFDHALESGPISAVSGLGLSVEKPRALTAERASIPCFASLADIQNMVGDPDSERLLREIQGKDAPVGSATRTIQMASNTALDAMSELKTQLSKYEPKGTYPNDRFGQGFKQIAQLVATSPQTRVVYFSAGGFDTHSRQEQNHARLMKGFSDSVAAFHREMAAIGKADKVVTLVFSEFGRRAYENGSAGTDHGKAGPMFLIGSKVKGGLYGPMPDLVNLDRGDLAYDIDFRQIYATALDDWLGGESKVVLGKQFDKLGLIS